MRFPSILRLGALAYSLPAHRQFRRETDEVAQEGGGEAPDGLKVSVPKIVHLVRAIVSDHANLVSPVLQYGGDGAVVSKLVDTRAERPFEVRPFLLERHLDRSAVCHCRNFCRIGVHERRLGRAKRFRGRSWQVLWDRAAALRGMNDRYVEVERRNRDVISQITNRFDPPFVVIVRSEIIIAHFCSHPDGLPALPTRREHVERQPLPRFLRDNMMAADLHCHLLSPAMRTIEHELRHV